jgi:hypothetical protein
MQNSFLPIRFSRQHPFPIPQLPQKPASIEVPLATFTAGTPGNSRSTAFLHLCKDGIAINVKLSSYLIEIKRKNTK